MRTILACGVMLALAGEVQLQAGDKKPAEDPAATRLLADARAARAVWKDFPGFTADIAVNDNGTLHKGRVDVKASGKVMLKLEGSDDLQKWTRREIASLVAHRLPAAESLKTPCAFADANDQHHPLGRKIRVLNDELHSSYRIRDNQIIEVNRTTPQVRFTITVLKNLVTKDKHFLPVSYVVDSWEPKSGKLVNSIAEHGTWQQMGAFEMPRTLLIVTSRADSMVLRESRLITFSDVQLAR